MSRTLRRPMFRGGRVSSYGTGIAAPLVPGYKGGGQIGGGIIAGLPHADGRYGFQNPIITGGEILEQNVPKSSYEQLVAAEKFKRGTIYDEDYIQDKWTEFQNDLYTGPGDVLNLEKEFGTGMQVWPEQGVETSAVLERIKQDPEGAYQDFKSGIIGGTDYATLQKEQIGAAETSGVDLGIKTDAAATEKTEAELENERLKKLLAAQEESTDIDAKRMVAENKELFGDLLGIKEARGDDITSMLLGFAGSKGDTTMEKFQDFAAKEAVRPGRRQKLEDAAGTLAIQDYVAGKRSKEQISQLKGIEDYKAKLKLETVMPQETDTLEEVAFKLNSAGLSYSSAKGLKMIIGIKDKTPMGDNVVTIDGIKIEDLEKGRSDKILKKLKTGYNIIDDDGVKRIIKYDGSGTVGGVDVYTISEFWNLKS